MTKKESVLLPCITILIAIASQVILSDRYTVGPKYLIALLESTALVVIGFSYQAKTKFQRQTRRLMALILVGMITFMNVASLLIAARFMIDGTTIDPHTLLLSAMAIFLTNIIIFGLWYWELDLPALTGVKVEDDRSHFAFPQQFNRNLSDKYSEWKASFADYLYLSLSTAMAFSPTDTVPLTHLAKLLMGIQSIISLATIVLVAAKAVNVIG
jgi:hypothetical protein